jgi:uncharacterized membrane protein YdbT with pleckstrin-like domain
MTKEEHVWSGTPSQIVNLGSFIILSIFFWLIFPLFIILWKWLVIKCTKYELTNQRLKKQYGVLNKKIDELELYRIKDYKLDQPFFLRLFSLGNIVLKTSDKSHPTVIIPAVSESAELREKIRSLVENLRDQKRIREVDFT